MVSYRRYIHYLAYFYHYCFWIRGIEQLFLLKKTRIRGQVSAWSRSGERVFEVRSASSPDQQIKNKFHSSISTSIEIPLCWVTQFCIEWCNMMKKSASEFRLHVETRQRCLNGNGRERVQAYTLCRMKWKQLLWLPLKLAVTQNLITNFLNFFERFT